MVTSDISLTAETPRIFSELERTLATRGDFRVTQRIRNYSLYAVGPSSISTSIFAAGFVVGILLFVFYTVLGILIFIALVAFYAYTPKDTVHAVIYSEESGKSTVSLTFHGRSAGKLANAISRRLSGLSGSPDAPDQKGEESDNIKKDQ